VAGGLITPESIDQVVERSDIVELVQQYTELKRRGNEWTGRCPFHDEKTPSFWVNDAKHVYHCFGCGASGDVIGFVREKQGVDFPQAVEFLAERYHVELAYVDGKGPDAQGTSKARLHELLGLTAAFYESFLWQASEAQVARDYIASRGITVETAMAFHLGYSPSAADGFSKRALAKGYTREELQEVRLVTTGNRDFFRARLMVPIIDRADRVIGFGARKLHEEQFGGKYMNSGSSRVFNKSHSIYAGPNARDAAKREGSVIVVEGYMDVIALHQAGFEHAVAVMGTAFPEQQVTELKRLATRALVAFDADPSGAAATLKALAKAQAAALDVRVVPLPNGMDPADVVLAEGGPENWTELAKGAVPLLRYRTEALLAAADLDSAPGRSKAFEWATILFGQVPPSPERSEEIARFSDRLQLDQPLRARLERAGQDGQGNRGRQASESATQRDRRAVPAAVRIERYFLAAALRSATDGNPPTSFGVEAHHFSLDVHRRAWALIESGTLNAGHDDRELIALWAELEALASGEFALGGDDFQPALRSYALRLEHASATRDLAALKQSGTRDLTPEQMGDIVRLGKEKLRLEQELRELPVELNTLT
jgi:DNA primase